MSDTWNLPPPQLFAPRLDLREALVEYEGLEAAVWVVDTRVCFGVLSERYPRVERWLLAESSNAELTALKRGVVSMRQVLAKDAVWIFDIDLATHDVIKSYRTGIETLPEMALPAPNAALPGAVAAGPCPQAFRLHSAAGPADSIPFEALSAVLGTIQRLWNAAVQALIGSRVTEQAPVPRDVRLRAELRALPLLAGSVIVPVVASDRELFKQATVVLHDLLEWSHVPDPNVDARFMGRRIQSAYIQLLTLLVTHEIDLEGEGDGGGFFVGHTTARHIVSRLRTGTLWQHVATMDIAGSFRAASVDGPFEFLTDEGEVLRGTILPAVLKEHPVIPVGDVRWQASVDRFSRTSASGKTEDSYLITDLEQEAAT